MGTHQDFAAMTPTPHTAAACLDLSCLPASYGSGIGTLTASKQYAARELNNELLTPSFQHAGEVAGVRMGAVRSPSVSSSQADNDVAKKRRVEILHKSAKVRLGWAFLSS